VRQDLLEGTSFNDPTLTENPMDQLMGIPPRRVTELPMEAVFRFVQGKLRKKIEKAKFK
jgi:hypothetical protein